MPAFEKAHLFTARWEGGYVNHPSDPGGATNYGVSLRWLKDIDYDVNGDGFVDINDIKDLSPEIASCLFYNEFWLPLKCPSCPPLVAIALYDSAVNTGNRQAIKLLQRACNALGSEKFKKDKLLVDGIFGLVTRARVEDLCKNAIDKPPLNKPSLDKESPELRLALALVHERELFHQNLAHRSPFINSRGQRVDYRPFIKGWLNRCTALELWITQCAREA